MAGTGASSPFIKDEPEDHFFSSSNQRFMANTQQGFNIPQQHFNQFGSHGGSINPSDLTMGGNGVAIPNSGYGSSFQNNFNNVQASNPNSSFSKGISTFNDDELLDSLGTMNDSHNNTAAMQNNGQEFGMDFDFPQNVYQNGANPLSVDPNHINGYSNTPDGDPIQSPFVHNFNHAQFRHMQHQHNFGNSLQSPASYTGSPLQGSDLLNGSADGFKQRPRLSQVIQGRKSSNTRSPLTPKTPAISSLNIGSAEGSSFPAQPIRTQSHRHQKTLSGGQWDHTPNSLTSFPGSEFSSPVQAVHPNAQISDILKGASMPTKLNGQQAGNAPAMQQTQEMKRRRRRESHNLVERRRRDNINERIQELSHLVPLHRLEDEKVRKALANNSPLSPTLAGLSHPPSGISPPQATSGLAGPGARRATAGNITTGIPIEEKDKGPNKGDILNGAVSWTRDLMWMLHLKLQQQEDLANIIADLGGTFPFEQTEDEKRMHTELMDAMLKNQGDDFQYTRGSGTGLRVPKHTDVKGEPLGSGQMDTSLSPDNHSSGDTGQAGMGGAGQYWSGHNSGGSGAGSISFKEEDEYAMNLDN
ncbi:Transcription factor [Hyphodiscus hymeniophilus]|uniref:Transcription factor n=1 Tax=Hyphodiscus hymeniophilus TaxID=353542 RepID=A0A9P7AY89_9HELO|nr:Transcription factor [Hyphodiscus hymeniophilus]